MGFLDYLHGGKKGAFKELKKDEKRRLELWKKHLADHDKRDALSRYFSYKNIAEAMKDLGALRKVINDIKVKVSDEFVDIRDEERTDEEILEDLKRLTSNTSTNETRDLIEALGNRNDKREAVRGIFRKMHDLLKTMLHTLKSVDTAIDDLERSRGGPDKIFKQEDVMTEGEAKLKNLLLNLFEMIFHKEALLYQPLKEHMLDKDDEFDKINKFVRAFIFEEDLKKELVSDEDKFIDKIVRDMGDEEARGSYRKLAESIYEGLAEEAGAPVEVKCLIKTIERVQKLMEDDALMQKIIRKKRPKLAEDKVIAVMKAFRKAYDLGHFMDVEADFLT